MQGKDTGYKAAMGICLHLNNILLRGNENISLLRQKGPECDVYTITLALTEMHTDKQTHIHIQLLSLCFPATDFHSSAQSVFNIMGDIIHRHQSARASVAEMTKSRKSNPLCLVGKIKYKNFFWLQ